MTYQTVCSSAACLLKIAGEIDISCAPLLKRLERCLKGRDSVIVDVAGVRYADTTFLRFLLRLRQGGPNAASRRRVRLIGVTQNLRRVLEITGLVRVFEIAAQGA
jgi:anti-anti-sigma factor